MSYLYTGRKVLLDSASTSTSGWFFVGDFRDITMSWQSSASLGPSRITVEVSNADGLQAADLPATTSATNASLLTGINIIGRSSDAIQLSAAGFRWLRATVAPANHSAASAVSVVVAGTVAS